MFVVCLCLQIAREILIHRGLEHKNVVRLHHFFEDTINAYIILENCSRKVGFESIDFNTIVVPIFLLQEPTLKQIVVLIVRVIATRENWV